MEYKMVTNEVNKNIKHRISTSTSQITKRFDIHPISKRRIEKVDNMYDQILQRDAKIAYHL